MPATIEALLDVNVLIAAIFEDHSDHVRAARFVGRLDHFYTCPTTQGGLLRFATRPWKDPSGVAQPPRLSVPDAHGKLEELTEVEGHVFLADDVAFAGLPLKSIVGHRQWTDAYLLQLARHHRLRLASFDRRMANLDDSREPVLWLFDEAIK